MQHVNYTLGKNGLEDVRFAKQNDRFCPQGKTGTLMRMSGPEATKATKSKLLPTNQTRADTKTKNKHQRKPGRRN